MNSLRLMTNGAIRFQIVYAYLYNIYSLSKKCNFLIDNICTIQIQLKSIFSTKKHLAQLFYNEKLT